jgi:hypothetical protein
MAKQSRLAKLMTDVMENIDQNKDGMNDGAYSDIMEKLREKYDELEKEDVLVERTWRESKYKVTYLSLAPRRREFRFNQKNYRKEFVSKIDYQYKTGIFVGKSLSKIYDNCLNRELRDRIDNGEHFHQVLNETIKEWNRPYEGMFDTKGSFMNNCECCITMTVCDSECEYDDSDDCECDKCSDIEVRATPVYILKLEKVIP